MTIDEITNELNMITRDSLEKTIECKCRGKYKDNLCGYTLIADYVGCDYINQKGYCIYSDKVMVTLKCTDINKVTMYRNEDIK